MALYNLKKKILKYSKNSANQNRNVVMASFEQIIMDYIFPKMTANDLIQMTFKFAGVKVFIVICYC